MNARYALGAEELIELGNPIKVHRASGSPMLIELGGRKGCLRPDPERRPFFAGKGIGQTSGMTGTQRAAMIGVAGAAFLAALVFGK